ncbi:nucleoside 2-deoxyribosyltransferase [Pseudoroseomonas cervicalis]|uniref:nucleoside 2-deoxyribosyltransferase n=1 Tax=Teichococcus cervicalis TaxID=204525 RepID=UPI0022F1C882|nr:nucleoside 2-deoxyribosyltransferase [Pseudoroseomonas cervicalis]WBV41777.1 nucleoside 2-deoxyribosyltransferase [Pseudoroseomonas cervicalis]
MRIYLAGPDVFLPDAAAIAAEKKAICARHGAFGIFPTDPIADPAAEAATERWYEIYLRNEAHIRAADAMIANLTPFRGPSADAGTVYEVGFMRALGRPVAGYTNSAEDFTRRTRAFLGEALRPLPDGGWADGEGLHLESFGCHDNLMIDGGIRASGAHLIARDVPEERRWRDLTAFEACLVSLLRGKIAA